MDEVFLRVLADAIARYLALAELSKPPSSTARQLAAGWRTVLRLHRPTVRRDCPGCRYRRGEMCDVWRVAVAYFLRPAGSGSPQPPRPDPDPVAEE